MQRAHVAIVGGGVGGLRAALLLEQSGVRDNVLLEARSRLGGRVLCLAPDVGASGPVSRFDLGPGWFWPDFQPQFGHLIHGLGLRAFPQYDRGDMLVEHSADSAPVRIAGHADVPTSMRVAGGMQALVDALRERVTATRIVTRHAVRRLRVAGEQVEIDAAAADGKIASWRVDHVLLAVPPRLAEATIAFSPPLPAELARQWRGTATWMAPHAKYVAVYAAAFWRDAGLSGEARSAAGPLGEIHDACIPDGRAALIGFIGLPARIRGELPEATLRELCRAQFVRLFGAAAARPCEDALQDWAREPYTAADHDLEGILEHPFAPAAAATSGPWACRLTGIGSEWSLQFPGYLAGAVEASERGVRSLLASRDQIPGGAA